MPEVRDQVKTQTPASTKKTAQGLTFRRLFTKPGVSPYNEVEWELRNAQITDSQGGTIFEQKNVEVPKDWSMTATNIVAVMDQSLGTSTFFCSKIVPPWESVI